jgi:hypothetical protein
MFEVKPCKNCGFKALRLPILGWVHLGTDRPLRETFYTLHEVEA